MRIVQTQYLYCKKYNILLTLVHIFIFYLDNLSTDRTEPQKIRIFRNMERTQSNDDVSGHLLSVLPGLLARGLLAAPLPALLRLPPRALLVSALPMSLRHRES